MKKLLLIASITFSVNAFAQPVITNGNNIAAVGTTATLYSATASGIGNPGANQTWDFSAVAFTAPGATWTVVAPSSTPHFASFPTANHAWTFLIGGVTRYFYFNVSATKMEVLADNLLTPGSGNDFTPNAKTALTFPFNYTNSLTDTYQKVGGAASTVTVVYDGYGTLITPFATYTNVWRTKEDTGNGNGTYTWQNENPLRPILVYTISNNSFTLFGNSAINSIEDKNKSQMSVELYPNPAKDKFVIHLPDFSPNSNLNLNLINIVGQVIKQVSINSESTTIETGNISSGIYFYQLQEKNITLKTGKFIVE